MAVRTIGVALLLSILPSAGCGTVANVARSGPENGMIPFGGVKHDLACLKAADGELGFKTHAKSESEHYPQAALRLFCAADLPFSLIGDVVTWPYTVTYAFINQPLPPPPVTLAPPIVVQSVTVPPATQPMPVPIPPATEPTTAPKKG